MRRDIRLFRAFQRVSARLRRDDKRDLAVRDPAVCLRVEQSLQICAAARDEDGNARAFQHKVTFSSPLTISPMT